MSGKIFKDSLGNSTTIRIEKSDIIPTIRELEKITKLPLIDNTLGSVGKKKSSGDIDLAVDQNTTSKDKLISILTDWAKNRSIDPTVCIRQNAISVHFRFPICGNVRKGFVQVDFMFGNDIKYMKFALSSAGDASKFSGADRNLLMSSVAKSLPGDFKYSWQQGLIQRSTSKILSKDPDQIAKALLGTGFTKDDLNSVETIIAAIRQNKVRLKALTTLMQRLRSIANKKPSEIKVDTEEADRIERILSAI